MIRCALYPLVLAATLLLSTAACSAPAAQDDESGDDVATEGPPAAAGPTDAAPDEPRARPSEPIATACTQIGCNDGLNVEIDGFDEEIEVELTSADGKTRTVTCVPPGPCHHSIPEFMPEEVTMTAFFPDREEERTFTPEYREERPNGPDCPPVCRQAQVRWKL